ncbi:TIGR04197 family type VII secretion effector [Enterococcus faecalis]
MSKIKNDVQQAQVIADGLSTPAQTPYVSEKPVISISNGSAVSELKAILADTKSLMRSFETSLQQDATNIQSISAAYEQADQAAKQVIEHAQ